MPNVVTGISASGDVRAVETALQEAGLPLDPLQVVALDDPVLGRIQPRVAQDDILLGTSGTGTGVPGLTTPQSRSTRQPAPFHQELLDRLAALEIPDDEIANYAEALEAGRGVVAYFAKPDNAEAVTAAFRAAGLAKLKTF